MNFKNLKIRSKLLIGFSALIVLLVIVGLIGYNSLSTVGKLLNEATTNRLPSVQSLQVINEAQTSIKMLERTLLIEDADFQAPEFRESQYQQVDEHWKIAEKAWSTYQVLDQSDEEKLAWNKFISSWGAWKKASNEFFNLSKENDKLTSEILKKHDGNLANDLKQSKEKLIKSSFNLRPLFSQAASDLDKVIDINMVISENLTKTANSVESFQNKLLLGIIIGGILLAMMIALIIASIISNPIKKIDMAARRIVEGDLNVTIDIDSQDEVGNLAGSFRNLIATNVEIVEKAKLVSNGDLTVTLQKRSENDELINALSQMVQKLKEIVGQIMESAQNVASASAQFSSSTVQIAEGANEQASSAEEVSSSVEEMNSTIQQNTENAVQTERIASSAAMGMSEVSDASQKSLEAIRQIADKIKVINAIAEKTDILAINAAIEAARAGEHGKGFAVVAAEVRKLAETSQKAAIEINTLSATSLKVTEEAGELMLRLIPDIQKTATLVQEISAASVEQSSGATQISQAIDQLSKVIQENSASAEEMSSTAEEMASQAEALSEVIGFFNTGKVIKKESVHIKPVQKNVTVKNTKKLEKGLKLAEILDGKDKDFDVY